MGNNIVNPHRQKNASGEKKWKIRHPSVLEQGKEELHGFLINCMSKNVIHLLPQTDQQAVPLKASFTISKIFAWEIADPTYQSQNNIYAYSQISMFLLLEKPSYREHNSSYFIYSAWICN